MASNNYTVLIPAAGVGSRFGANIPKQYIQINHKPILQHTINIFTNHKKIGRIVVVISTNDELFSQYIQLPPNGIVLKQGGQSRAHSVLNGLNTLLQEKIINEDEIILVHDAVRCCLPQTALNRLLDHAHAEHGCILALPVTDTLKQAKSSRSEIEKTISRKNMWYAQTPQLFPVQLLHRALNASNLDHISDESSAIEYLGIHPLLVEGDSSNIKVTHPHDLPLANYLLNPLLTKS